MNDLILASILWGTSGVLTILAGVVPHYYRPISLIIAFTLGFFAILRIAYDIGILL